MTKPASIDVSALTDGFAPSLIAELRDSIDSGGDCAVCRRDLGDSDVVIDACSIPGVPDDIISARARHASCDPVAAHPGTTIMPSPTWRGMERVVDVNGEPFVIVTLNPSIDHHIVRRGSGDAHLTDIWRELGFCAPGTVRIGDKGVGSVQWFPSESSIEITTGFGQYGFGAPALVSQAIRDRGGLMLAALFDRDATSADEETTRAFVSCPYAAHGWVRYVAP